MNALDEIRNKIQRLYHTNPHIRINVSLKKPKINLTNEQVTIKGVYPYVFRIEEQSGNLPQIHTLQYSDILIGYIDILDEI